MPWSLWLTQVWLQGEARTRCSALPAQLLQGLRSAFQHCPQLPAQPEPRWAGEGTEVLQPVPCSKGHVAPGHGRAVGMGARVWPERGAEHLLLWGALRSLCSTWSSWAWARLSTQTELSSSAEHPGFDQPGFCSLLHFLIPLWSHH